MHVVQLPDSMAKAVAMFNILHEQNITEEQAWHLLTLVDLSAALVVRQKSDETLATKPTPVAVTVTVHEPATTVEEPAVEPELTVKAAPELPAEDDITSMADIPEEAWNDPARHKFGAAVDDIPEEAWRNPAGATSGAWDTEPDVYETSERWWTRTHLWKIHVEAWDRDGSEHKSYYVHCRHRPSQELFNQHYQHYRAGTHKVYVLQSNGSTSTDITRSFLFSGKPVTAETASVKSTDWEEDDADFRIRFWDTRVGGLNYVYFRNRPSGIVLAKYHNAKQCAVVESRPVH